MTKSIQFTGFYPPTHKVQVRYRGEPRAMTFLTWCHNEVKRLHNDGYGAWVQERWVRDAKTKSGKVKKIAIFTDYDWKKKYGYSKTGLHKRD